MPVVTDVSLLLYGVLAIAISTSLINQPRAPIYNGYGDTDPEQHGTHRSQALPARSTARPGELLESVREERASVVSP